MKILADKRIPDQAKINLEKFGEVIFLETRGITYPAISGHPDIFFCKTRDRLVCAPNAPKIIIDNLYSKIAGKYSVGEKYPETAFYNAVVTDKYLIHNQRYTDSVLKEKCRQLDFIQVTQAYTRCNLIALNNDRFITSDKGIEKALANLNLEVLFVNPQGISLPGFDHGFFGGTCGLRRDQIFFVGSLDHVADGEKIRKYLSNYDIIELYDGPLYDGGSIIFLDKFTLGS